MDLKLFYMGDSSGMNEEQRKTALDFIVSREYITFATDNKETGPRLSALNNLPGQKITELYFGTDVNSQKVKNLWDNPVCEIMYTDGCSQIMLSGKATVVNDPEIKKEKWQPEMIEHFTDGPEGEVYCVIKFEPFGVRAMIV